MDDDYLFEAEISKPLKPNETRTKIIDEVHHDSPLNKPFLYKKDVEKVYYYDSKSKSTFQTSLDDDAVDDKIYLNVISNSAQKKFDVNREGAACLNDPNSGTLSKRIDTKFKTRTTLEVNEEVLVKVDDQQYGRTWERARVLEFRKTTREVVVELMYIKSKDDCRFIVPFHNIAYLIPPYTRITKALRVIAKVYSDDVTVTFLSGRIIDLAKKTNDFRYLVFFENGLTTYTSLKDIAIVLDQSKIHENFSIFQKEFLTYYFKHYPEVSTPKYKIGEQCTIRIKRSHSSDDDVYYVVKAKVNAVDCKLVEFKTSYQVPSIWLFRGDYTRILSMKSPARSEKEIQRIRPIRNIGSHQNVIEITLDEDEIIEGSDDLDDYSDNEEARKRQIEEAEALQNELERQLERQSRVPKPIAGEKLPEVSEELRERDLTPPIVPVIDYIAKKLETVKIHDCSRDCLSKKEFENLDALRGISIYAQPIYFGWNRLQEYNARFIRRICYLTPCGLKLYDIESVFDYLQATQSFLQIDQFSFDPIFVTQVVDLPENLNYVYIEDLSRGSEKNQPVSLVNNRTTANAVDFEYVADRIYDENVKICQDTNFLVCCDCTDDCRNASKCACQCLTLSFANEFHDLREHPTKYRLLNHKLMTGIYECNQGCVCMRRERQCINRNGQFNLRNKLQVFQTAEKGWGVRTLHDMPKGAFICTYSGIVLDSQAADQQGSQHGDTYLADLDLLENLESAKLENQQTYDLEDDNQNERVTDATNVRSIMNDGGTYAINGALKGNVGRFFNHSCDPNAYAQNIFVDTHDLRFPWISFYTLCYIPAYTEITWDYNYTVGCIEGRRLDCMCGSDNCRGRLL